MTRHSFMVALAATTALLLLDIAHAAEPISVKTFDVPGAVDNDLFQAYVVPGINDDGVVVGTFGTSAGGAAGFIRRADGQIEAPIVDPNGPEITLLYKANEKDIMVGWYSTDGLETAHSFFLINGNFTAYDFPGAISTAVRGINNRGDITGTINLAADGPDIGFLVRRHGQRITFPSPTGAIGFAPEAINDRGVVVGYYFVASGENRGFVRTKDGTLRDVVFPNSIGTRAYGINDCGTIVGFYRAADTSLHGFYGRYNDLQAFDVPGGTATRALGINNEGRIVGSYRDAKGPHMFVTSEVDG